MAAERSAGLSEKRTVFFHGAHREFTARFIGLVRVFKGNRRTSEAFEAQVCCHWFFSHGGYEIAIFLILPLSQLIVRTLRSAQGSPR